MPTGTAGLAPNSTETWVGTSSAEHAPPEPSPPAQPPPPSTKLPWKKQPCVVFAPSKAGRHAWVPPSWPHALVTHGGHICSLGRLRGHGPSRLVGAAPPLPSHRAPGQSSSSGRGAAAPGDAGKNGARELTGWGAAPRPPPERCPLLPNPLVPAARTPRPLPKDRARERTPRRSRSAVTAVPERHWAPASRRQSPARNHFSSSAMGERGARRSRAETPAVLTNPNEKKNRKKKNPKNELPRQRNDLTVKYRPRAEPSPFLAFLPAVNRGGTPATARFPADSGTTAAPTGITSGCRSPEQPAGL